MGARGAIWAHIQISVIRPGENSGYLPTLTKLAAQTEFSQLENDCSGSSKDGHGLKFER